MNPIDFRARNGSPEEPKPWRPLNVALIGCGAVANLYYAPALRALEQAGKLRVKALSDPEADKMAALRKHFAGAVSLARLADVTDHAIDLAIVASPPRSHAEQSIQLLQNGIAVLCEKPMATTLAEGEAMIAAAAATGQVLAIGLSRRFFPATQMLKQLLSLGALGPVQHFVCTEGDHFRWPAQSLSFFRKEVAKGGVLLDIGVHVLDLLVWWWGEPVAVHYEDDAMGGVEANCRLHLTFAQGHSGEVRLSRDWPLPNRYQIQCERGWLGWRVNEADKVQAGYDGAVYVFDGALHVASGSDQPVGLGKPAFTFKQSFVSQLLNVAAAVQGQAEPLAPGVAGLQSLRLIEQCYQHRQLMAMPWLDADERAAARQFSGLATQ